MDTRLRTRMRAGGSRLHYQQFDYSSSDPERSRSDDLPSDARDHSQAESPALFEASMPPGEQPPLQCTGKPYLLKAQHSAFNIVDSKTIPLTVQNWQITSFVPDSTDLVLDSSNICLAVRTVGMQRCPGFHKNVSFPK